MIRKPHPSRFAILPALVLSLTFAVGAVWAVAESGSGAPVSSTPSVRIVRVGLLSDTGCTDARSREAAWNVLKKASDSAGLEVRRVSAAAIRSDGPAGLSSLDVVIFPGGTGGGEGKDLGVDGARRVTEFVKNGGGVIAICAGGYLVVNGWTPETRAIELLNASSWDDKHWARGEGFIAVQVLGVDDAQSSRTMWFQNGPIFVPRGLDTLPAYTALVRYVSDLAPKGAPRGLMTGRDAVIAAPLDEGRVVAFGPHPELSPGLHHWLVNAVRWAAGARIGQNVAAARKVKKSEGGSPTGSGANSIHSSPPTVASVLEGK